MQTYNPEPIQDLWIAVLNQAKKDVSSRSNYISNVAISWFESKSTAPGSFLWICDLFSINPQIITKKIFQE